MLEFAILGPLEVRMDGLLVPIGGVRQRALLAMLLLHANEIVSSDRLIEELWGGEPRADTAVLRVLRSRKNWSVALAGVAVIGTFAAVAFGSLGVGFTPTNLVTASIPDNIDLNADGIKFRTDGPIDVRVQKIEIAPGGFSGWHHHPGMTIVSVASGAVTVTTSNCGSTTYGPGLPTGSAFIETGTDPGQASSVAGATIYVTFLAPHASPPVFRIEDPAQPQPCVPRTDGRDDGGDDNAGGGGPD